MQIAGIGTQTRIMPRKITQISGKHAVMIAQKGDPILPPDLTLHEIVDHAGAVRATVNQITDVNDGTGAMRGLIGVYAGMRGLEKPQLAMNVADGVGSCHCALTPTAERRDI